MQVDLIGEQRRDAPVSPGTGSKDAPKLIITKFVDF